MLVVVFMPVLLACSWWVHGSIAYVDIFYAVLAVLVVGCFAAVVMNRFPGSMPQSVPDKLPVSLPDSDVSPTDVADVRFPLELRGYQMQAVDAALETLTQELAARDAEIERLRSQIASQNTTPGQDVEPPSTPTGSDQ